MSPQMKQEMLFDLHIADPSEDLRVIDFPITQELIYDPINVTHCSEFYPCIDPTFMYAETEPFCKTFAGLGAMTSPDDELLEYDHETFHTEFENGEVLYQHLEILWYTDKDFLFPCRVTIKTEDGENKEFYITWHISKINPAKMPQTYERTCTLINYKRQAITPIPEKISEQKFENQADIVMDEYTEPGDELTLTLGMLEYTATVIEKNDHRQLDTITEWVFHI